MKLAAVAVAIAVSVSPALRAWGPEGHAAIGLVAEQRLTPATRGHVERILGNDDLASIASWMDEVRGAQRGFGKLAADPEAREFTRRYPHNDVWHYVDLPLGEARYSDNDPFSRTDDVVHQLNLAIRVLEGKSDAVSPRIALYMMVHLVGDLHQPLHVACGYYDLSDLEHPVLLKDPKAALGKPDDKGANDLKFGPHRYDELHGDWDSGLPEKVAGSRDPAVLAKVMMNAIQENAWATPGDHHTWAEQWATESLMAAREVYRGIEFGPAEMADGTLRSIHVTLPANYDAVEMPVAARRLAQAGYHLAELLNAIDWK